MDLLTSVMRKVLNWRIKMLTRKHFKAVAEIIRTSRDVIITYSTNKPAECDVADNLADYFATQNPRFDRERFLAACGLGD